MKKKIKTAFASFPIDWNFGDEPCDGHGGPPTSDPSVIYVSVPADDPEDDPEEYLEISLKRMVYISIDSSRAGKKIGAEHVKSMTALRDLFLSLAKQIDDHLVPNEKD